MKTKILTIFIVLILTFTSLGSIASALETCGEETNPVADSDVVEVTKMIRDNDKWVNKINASIDDILRFNISITYHDSDGDGPAYMIRNIEITDTLPGGLEYLGDATTVETSNESNVVIWDLGKDFHLNETHPTFNLEFNVKVVGHGTLINNVHVKALEKCISVWRNVDTSATVFVSGGTCDFRSIDVEPDQSLEHAYDYNNDSSDGFESYVDPDGSSEAVKSIDGDQDGKIDHFVDIDGNNLPEKYWDPDDIILSNISIIDVDYDGTYEWVYDSNGDHKNDRYYDPDDGQIYPYEVYTLIVNDDGHGSIEKDPNGILFLTWKLHEVELTAVSDEGYVFDYWSGDVPEENESVNPLTITMDSNKTITAHFKVKEVEGGPSIKIIKPKENWLYKFNFPVRPYLRGTKIVGPITIKVKAKSDKGIDRVEFFIDNKSMYNDTRGVLHIYKWTWFLKPRDGKTNYTIKVVAYDKDGNSNSTELEVIRNRYRPLRDTPLLTIGTVTAGALALFRNRSSQPDQQTPPGDNGGGGSGNATDNNAPEEKTTEPEEASKSVNKEENFDPFWYIVAGLAILLLAITGLLFVRRKIYE